MTDITLTDVPAVQTGDEIPRGVKFSWSVGAFGVFFMMNVIAGYALFFMVSVLNIEPALAGFIAFFPKIFDALTDPVIGGWSDRYKTKGSRRRPFLLWGAVLSALSFAMIFTTPVFENEYITASYIFVALMAYSLGYTLYNIPYMAMPAEMTNDYHERTSIHSYRTVSVSISGLLVGGAVPLLLEAMGRDSWDAYAMIGVGGGIIIFLTMMVAWVGTKDARFSTAPVERPKIMSELGHVFANKHYLRLLAVKFCQLFGIAATIAAIAFFVLNVLQSDFKVLTYYGIASGLSAIIAAPILARVSKKVGKSRTYIVAALCYVAVVASWALVDGPEPLWAIVLRGVIIGVATAGNIMMAMSMLTDIINHDSKINNTRREGIFVAFYSFIEKFTFAFGPLVVGVALTLAGFDKSLPSDAMQSPEVRHAILLGMSYIPAAMGLISIWLLMGYKLTEEDLK